jgi:hypothetical protein
MTTRVSLTFSSYADCPTRARNVPPPHGRIYPDASGRVVIPDTYRVEWNTDGAPPYFAECSAVVTCLPPLGPTRTLGYFKTHPAATSACLSSGPVDLGFMAISSADAALGLMWARPSKYADETKRSSFDQSRVLLGRQLLVATCNERVFGSSAGDELLTNARATLAGSASCSTMNWHAGQLDAFNNSGDTGENWFGSASPGAWADPTSRTSFSCQ